TRRKAREPPTVVRSSSLLAAVGTHVEMRSGSRAKINLHDQRVAGEPVRRSFVDFLAVMHDDHPRRQTDQEAHDMLYQDDADALRLDALNDVNHPIDFFWRQP